MHTIRVAAEKKPPGADILSTREWRPQVRKYAFVAMGLLASPGLQASSPEFELGFEFQAFLQDGASRSTSYKDTFNSDITVTWDKSFNQNRWLFELDAYLAWDQRDKQRQRIDLHSLALGYYASGYDVKFGVMTEFWGVTESRHLVDILNQSSIADNIDEEVKLGQPMLRWQTHREWGNLQMFWLPAFRERLFPEPGSRLSPALPVDDDLVAYASAAGEWHQDFAIRYANTLGNWDIGLAHFRGTSREPLLQPAINDHGAWVLSSFYEQIEQSSLDLQHTGDGLLLKLEAIHRRGSHQGSYNALVTGLEFTQVGLMGSVMDLGYIAEYLYDQRDEQATTPFQDDLFLGLRLAANNIAQTSLLVGVYQDLHNSGQALRLELDTRLRDDLVLKVEGQAFRNLASTDLLYGMRNDDYMRISLKFYF